MDIYDNVLIKSMNIMSSINPILLRTLKNNLPTVKIIIKYYFNI